MTVIILDQSTGTVHIEEVQAEDDIWCLGYKESECSWMEIKDVSQVLVMAAEFNALLKRRWKGKVK